MIEPIQIGERLGAEGRSSYEGVFSQGVAEKNLVDELQAVARQ